MYYIGIDSGKTGAWAVIKDFPASIHTFPFVNYRQFYTAITTHFNVDESFGILEEPVLTPVWSPKARMWVQRKGAKEYMANFGGWRAALEMLGISHQLVGPQKWQKAILGSVPKGKTKEYAFNYITRKYPNLNCKKKDDGVIDALCIAEYARKLHLQEIREN